MDQDLTPGNVISEHSVKMLKSQRDRAAGCVSFG